MSTTAAKSKPLYSAGIKRLDCDRFAHIQVEKRFKCRLHIEPKEETRSTSTKIMLDAMVLDNNICVLMSPVELMAKELIFNEYMNDSAVYGKQKKGARHLFAGDELCRIVLLDDSTITVHTPISGKLIEVNDSLQSNVQLLHNSQHKNEGYFCILTSEAPKIIERSLSTNNEIALDDMIGRDQICFGWIQGNCKRGDGCKFKHSYNNNPPEKAQ
jgi:hypothetical protein